MEEFIATVFGWIGENENVLSGLVAIAVLLGLVAAGARRLALKPRAKQRAETEIIQEIRYAPQFDVGRQVCMAIGTKGLVLVD